MKKRFLLALTLSVLAASSASASETAQLFSEVRQLTQGNDAEGRFCVDGQCVRFAYSTSAVVMVRGPQGPMRIAGEALILGDGKHTLADVYGVDEPQYVARFDETDWLSSEAEPIPASERQPLSEEYVADLRIVLRGMREHLPSVEGLEKPPYR